MSFRKIDGIFQWSITENKLLSNGQIKPENLIDWKKSSGFSVTDSTVREGIDYHTLTYEHRGINLDRLEAPSGFTVTGVRFQMHNGNLNLEIRITEFDFNTGLLSSAHEWISNKHIKRTEINLIQPGIPTIYVRHYFPHTEPITGARFITFQPTDIDKDIAQHTVPFIADSLLRDKNEAYLLSGIGISWMKAETTGGVIVPKMVAYNFQKYIETLY